MCSPINNEFQDYFDQINLKHLEIPTCNYLNRTQSFCNVSTEDNMFDRSRKRQRIGELGWFDNCRSMSSGDEIPLVSTDY